MPRLEKLSGVPDAVEYVPGIHCVQLLASVGMTKSRCVTFFNRERNQSKLWLGWVKRPLQKAIALYCMIPSKFPAHLNLLFFVSSILLSRVTPIRVGPHSGSHNGPRLDSCLRSGDVYQSAISSTHYGLGPAQMMTLMNLVVVIMMVTTIMTAELIIRGTSIMCRSNKL